MSDEIMTKLKEHDEQLETIALTVADHTEMLDKSKRLLEINTKQLDALTLVVVENKQQMEDIKEKLKKIDDIAVSVSNITTTLDYVAETLKKKDQEMAMVTEGMRRHERMLESLMKV